MMGEEEKEVQIYPMLNQMIIKAIRCEKDANKFDNWNVSAGKRLRKEFQEMRFMLKDMRAEIQKKKMKIVKTRKRMKRAAFTKIDRNK